MSGSAFPRPRRDGALATTERLTALLSKMVMTTHKSVGQCSVEFRATLALGTWRDLQAEERQLAGLPPELAETCRRIFAEASFQQVSLQDVPVPRLAICDRSELLAPITPPTRGVSGLAWERTVLLERVQVRKEEDRDLQARARLVFVIQLNEGEPWPGRELVGKWLSLVGMGQAESKR